ncbi:DALR anticodon-binding domain-containing protein 3 [Latimeria chalumnae]|uniref:DALR anticodon-binding domain-containing protein 3 n=1 Tax=Latimeria chalumnae TaxID=7897 RepID=UPI00313B3080
MERKQSRVEEKVEEGAGNGPAPVCLQVPATVEALNAVLFRHHPPPPGTEGGSLPTTAWFKETSSKNLRSRDFIAPRGALCKILQQEQVPESILQEVMSLKLPGVLPVRSCKQAESGLLVQLERPVVFQQVLSNLPAYRKPAGSESVYGQHLVLNCVPLRKCQSLETLQLNQLRAILVADHLTQLLRRRGHRVQLLPTLRSDSDVENFLQRLGVDWPSTAQPSPNQDTVSGFKRLLSGSCYTAACSPGIAHESSHDALSEGVQFKVRLKQILEERGLQGYDPNLDVFLVEEENLAEVTELKEAVLKVPDSPGGCMVLHIVCSEGEFQQQKIDLLWRILDAGTCTSNQRHLVCGPVKVAGCDSPVNTSQYVRIRRSQMLEASLTKYGDVIQGESWDDLIGVMTSAVVRFEMLAAAHRSPMTVDLTEEASVSTKGTKGGAFVMYNCARLATLFESYHRSVQQGLYPEFPETSELNFSALREEGEWLLLFNYIIAFPEVLGHSGQLLRPARGTRVTANTEVVCKFLVHLSMDFSSYYNRVHILGEPLPHLFGQMFARLHLMRAVQEIFIHALETLHIPPLNQI